MNWFLSLIRRKAQEISPSAIRAESTLLSNVYGRSFRPRLTAFGNASISRQSLNLSPNLPAALGLDVLSNYHPILSSNLLLEVPA